jgi:hypothetical protein
VHVLGVVFDADCASWWVLKLALVDCVEGSMLEGVVLLSWLLFVRPYFPL